MILIKNKFKKLIKYRKKIAIVIIVLVLISAVVLLTSKLVEKTRTAQCSKQQQEIRALSSGKKYSEIQKVAETYVAPCLNTKYGAKDAPSKFIIYSDLAKGAYMNSDKKQAKQLATEGLNVLRGMSENDKKSVENWQIESIRLQHLQHDIFRPDEGPQL